MLNGILWILRAVAPWRDLPERYGPWRTVSSRFYRWQKAGIWQRLLAASQAVAVVANFNCTHMGCRSAATEKCYAGAWPNASIIRARHLDVRKALDN